MTKFIKKFGVMTCLAMLMVVVFSVPTVSASSVSNDIDITPPLGIEVIDGVLYFLLQEDEFVDEDGNIQTSRLYSTVNPLLRSQSGSGTFRHNRTFGPNAVGTVSMSGLFSWNSGLSTATVTNAQAAATAPSRYTITNRLRTTGNNQGVSVGPILNRFAWIQFEFNWDVSPGTGSGRSRTRLEVNQNGVPSYVNFPALWY